MAVLGVGGLHVGIVVQDEAATLVEMDAADAELVGRRLSLEDDRLALLFYECFECFATISL